MYNFLKSRQAELEPGDGAPAVRYERRRLGDAASGNEPRTDPEGHRSAARVLGWSLIRFPPSGDVSGFEDLRTRLFDVVCDGGQVAHFAARTDFRLAV